MPCEKEHNLGHCGPDVANVGADAQCRPITDAGRRFAVESVKYCYCDYDLSVIVAAAICI